MTTKDAIRELKEIRQYCTATSLVALNYAIEVLKDKVKKEEAEQKDG